MARRKKRINWQLRLVLGGLAFFVLYLGWTALDQHRYFTKYETAIAEQQAKNAEIQEEIAVLEESMERKDDLDFIMELAIKYGMVPTDLTPTPVVLPENNQIQAQPQPATPPSEEGSTESDPNGAE